MKTVKQLVIDALSVFPYPVYLQGTLNPDAGYPDSFFTFWVFQADETRHYDNAPVCCDWGLWLNFYSSDAELVEIVSLQAKARLREAGFVFDGKPTDANSDTNTHTGCLMTCYFKEVYENGRNF